MKRHSLLAQLVDITDHHNAIQHRDTEQCNKADSRRQAQIEAAQPQGRHAADQRKGQIHDDERRIFQRTERGVKQHENQ